jgi:hypothetical protein
VIYDTKPLLNWINDKQIYSVVFEGFDSKRITVTLKNYTDILDTKSFAKNEIITFYSFENSISMKLLQIQKNNISLISDQCNDWKTYDFDTCQCECDSNTKELCITKGFDWNEKDCSCNKPISEILCPVIVESVDLLFISTPTIYGECPKDYVCDVNTGICNKQLYNPKESRPRLHWWD